MKILGGTWRGRPLAQPKSSTTRPMSDKLRAVVFDVLGPVDGLTMLDAYAGSGALGLEALSRGALLVEAIEAHGPVAKVIQANASALGAGFQYLLHQMTVTTWLTSPVQQSSEPRYDVIMADPPYAQLEPDILDQLTAHVKLDGVFVLSHSSKRPAPMLESGELVRTKDYGDSTLSFYRRR